MTKYKWPALLAARALLFLPALPLAVWPAQPTPHVQALLTAHGLSGYLLPSIVLVEVLALLMAQPVAEGRANARNRYGVAQRGRRENDGDRKSCLPACESGPGQNLGCRPE